jgi:hypothetical protein
MSVNAVTFADNTGFYGAAIHNDGALTEIANCIFKGLPGVSNLNSTSGTILSHGYNVCSDNGSGILTGPGDQINIDPLLGPLADNGGTTRTMLPAWNSPAIDQGKRDAMPSLARATDQRGRARPFTNAVPPAALGDHTDVGAVEYSPAFLVVSNLNDAGPGSLREAIGLVIPGELDVITFASNLAGRIILGGSELQLNKSMSILGPGPRQIALDGNAANTVFVVNSGSAVIAGVTITNGVSGLYSAGGSTLVLSNCVVAGNSGSQYAGGIANEGNITIRNCTICSNQAIVSVPGYVTAGGGLFNNAGGVAVVVNSTFAGNVTVSDDPGAGGAIFQNGARLSLTNCTVVGNASRLGGGIYNNTTPAVIVSGCIIAKNTSLNGHPDVDGSAFGSGGYNLIGDTSGSTAFLGLQDQHGSSASPLNPLVGPLGYYGGPTPTCPLLKGSPAIDKGKTFGLATDQRGAPRPFDFSSVTNAPGGDGSDIGAVEFSVPVLKISRAVGNVVLSWPAYDGEFTAESVTNLLATNTWTTAPGVPAVVGNELRLTNTITGNRFFRLKSL